MELEEYLHVFAIVNTLLTVVGVTANILGAVVLAKMQKTVPGVRLLKYLAVLDVLLLCLILVTLCVRNYQELSLQTYDNINYLTRVTYPISMTCYMCEAYLTALIGCQRALALVSPHRYQVMKDSVINIILLGCVLFSTIFNIPVWMELKYEEVWIESLKSNVTQVFRNEEFQNTSFFKLYDKYLILIFRAVLPLLILIVCNIAIVVVIRNRSGSSSVTQTAFELARINVAVITMSILSHIPSALERMIDFPVRLIQPVHLLVILNSSVNFLFYCVSSRMFRNTLKIIFKCQTTSEGAQIALNINSNSTTDHKKNNTSLPSSQSHSELI